MLQNQYQHNQKYLVVYTVQQFVHNKYLIRGAQHSTVEMINPNKKTEIQRVNDHPNILLNDYHQVQLRDISLSMLLSQMVDMLR